MTIDISVLVPVYRSEKSLTELYSRLTKVLCRISTDYEIILVDDFSPDHSFNVMQNLHKQDSRVKIIQLTSNFGQHNATFCGFNYCKGAFIVTLDDDLQHQPEEIPKLIDKIQEGYDVVMGIPRKRQDAFYKDWGSLLINKCLNLIYQKSPDIRMSSFRILRKEMVQQIIAHPRSNIYIGALILDQQPKLSNIEISHAPRKYGKSNYSIKKSVDLAWKLISCYSNLPLRIADRLWQISLIIGIALLLMTRWINKLDLTIIWGSLIILICLLNLISVQILKHYIMMIQQETIQAKPAYIIGQIEL